MRVPIGREGELDVAPAFHAQGADDFEGRGPEHLVLPVRQALAGRDHDAIPRVDAQRVHVLHVAHRDAGVAGIPHDLVLNFPPALQVAFHQHLGDGAEVQGPPSDGLGLLRGVGHTAAGAAQGVGRPQDDGIAQVPRRGQDLFHGVAGAAFQHRLADFPHEFPEEVPVLCAADGLQGRAQEPDVVLFQHAGLGQGHGQVEAGLAAQGGEQAVGPFPRDDVLQHLHGEGFHVDHIRDGLIGHDGGGVGIHQDDFHAFLTQGPAGLGAGVIKLRGLPDDNGSGTNDQDFHGGPPRGVLVVRRLPVAGGRLLCSLWLRVSPYPNA